MNLSMHGEITTKELQNFLEAYLINYSGDSKVYLGFPDYMSLTDRVVSYSSRDEFAGENLPNSVIDFHIGTYANLEKEEEEVVKENKGTTIETVGDLLDNLNTHIGAYTGDNLLVYNYVDNTTCTSYTLVISLGEEGIIILPAIKQSMMKLEYAEDYTGQNTFIEKDEYIKKVKTIYGLE